MKTIEWHYVRGLIEPDVDLASIFQLIRGLSGSECILHECICDPRL